MNVFSHWINFWRKKSWNSVLASLEPRLLVTFGPIGNLVYLLQNNGIEYAVEVPEELKNKLVIRCRVQVQKETSEGLVDGLCDEIAPRNYAGYCQ